MICGIEIGSPKEIEMARVEVVAKNTGSKGKQRCCICRRDIPPHIRHFAYEVIDPDDNEADEEIGGPPFNPVLRTCSDDCQTKLENIVDDGLVATARHNNPYASFMFYLVEKDVNWAKR